MTEGWVLPKYQNFEADDKIDFFIMEKLFNKIIIKAD